jgi:hypothetical protein
MFDQIAGDEELRQSDFLGREREELEIMNWCVAAVEDIELERRRLDGSLARRLWYFTTAAGRRQREEPEGLPRAGPHRRTSEGQSTPPFGHRGGDGLAVISRL